MSMFFDSVFAVLIFFEHSLGLYLAPLFLSFQHALICYKVNKHDHTCVNLSVCLFVSFNLCNLCKPTILQKILDFCHNGSTSLKLYSTAVPLDMQAWRTDVQSVALMLMLFMS